MTEEASTQPSAKQCHGLKRLQDRLQHRLLPSSVSEETSRQPSDLPTSVTEEASSKLKRFQAKARHSVYLHIQTVYLPCSQAVLFLKLSYLFSLPHFTGEGERKQPEDKATFHCIAVHRKYTLRLYINNSTTIL